jgi:hypothetical protein
MTQDEIIEMATQAELNLYVHDLTEKRYIEVIETFAKLVAAKEREACAKLCDSTVEQTYISGYTGAVHSGKRACAAAIRARGQA